MINAYWEELEFHVQEGTAQEWKRIVDTALPSPGDLSDYGVPLEQAEYVVAPRSMSCYFDPEVGSRTEQSDRNRADRTEGMDWRG
jgi:hypothetical protein